MNERAFERNREKNWNIEKGNDNKLMKCTRNKMTEMMVIAGESTSLRSRNASGMKIVTRMALQALDAASVRACVCRCARE